MAKTNAHRILQLRRKISLMAEELEGLRIELSKKEEKVFFLEQKLDQKKFEISLTCLPCKNKLHYYSVSQTLQGGGNRD